MKPGSMTLLRSQGVHLFVDKGRLRYRVPMDALQSLTLRQLISEAAGEYEERAAIREYDAGMGRADAERLALTDLLAQA